MGTARQMLLHYPVDWGSHVVYVPSPRRSHDSHGTTEEVRYYS